MAPLRPNDIDLTQEERTKWTALAKLDYQTARTPDPALLTELGIDVCFRELCQQGQLTRLFLEPGPPSYHRLTLEFLSTLDVAHEREVVLGLRFQLRNVRYEWTVAQFNEVFGFTGRVIKEPFEFRGQVNKFWGRITATQEKFSASNSKATQIRNPVLRLLQKACTCYPFARKEQGSVHREELFLLWTILHRKPPLNMGHFMIKHLERAAKKRSGHLCVGKVISVIALHLGVNMDGLVADHGGDPIDLFYLKRAGMIDLPGLRVPSGRTRIVLLQRDKDHFPLPNTALTYVNGPDQRGNWGMNTPAHRALTTGGGAGFGPSSSSSDEEEDEDEEEEEEEDEDQPESRSRAKRSRPRDSTSAADYLRTIVEGMSTMQLGQAQQASILEQMQQWHQADLDWRAGVNAQLADIRATQEAQGAQLHNLQMQHDIRWTQEQARHAQDDARNAEHQAFFQAYYARFPPQD